MIFKIDLPIEADEIEIDIADKNKSEGHIWFKKTDLCIDFIIDENKKICLHQVWITGSQQYELKEVPYLQNWVEYNLEKHKNKIMEIYEYSLLN